jgi:dTDP-glucose 4,6-dehydratase
MAIVITGGAGFIGSNFILNWCSDTDEPIINIDKLTYAGNLDNLISLKSNMQHNFINGDIGDVSLLDKILREYSPRAIINFAAESHVDRSIDGPDEFIQTNIIGTYKLLQSTLDYWRNLDDQKKNKFRFLHISTDEVFGSLGITDPPFSETNRYEPSSPYSASKAASDHLARAWHHTYELPVIITNCSNNYGPFQFPEKLIPLVITNALDGKIIPIYGDGMQIRDWLYVEDHCNAIFTVLKDGIPGQTYNIGGHNEKSNIELVNMICLLLDDLCPKKNGTSYRDQITYVTDRPGHDRRYAINAEKIENELNWKPSETFKTGIYKTVKWYLDHQEWTREITNRIHQYKMLNNKKHQ